MQDAVPNWFTFMTSPEGRTVFAWEEAAFARTVAHCNGDRAVQIGCSVLDPLKTSVIGHHVLVTEEDVTLEKNDWRTPVTALSTELPLQSECSDLVVWPHGVDAPTSHPEASLREIHRILAPSGVLILTFFNASGFWSLKQRLGGRTVFPSGTIPQNTNHVKTLLTRANLNVEGGFYGVYGTAEGGKTGLLPTKLDLAGNRWWPTLSNVVLLVARKRVQGVTLVGRTAFARHQRTIGALQQN